MSEVSSVEQQRSEDDTMSEKKLTAISLYSGGGGLDYGFEAAGFDTRVALDLDYDSCETLRANREWPVIEGDIEDCSSEVILDTANLREGDADVLIGGPPCQPFSKAGFWASGEAKRLEDPRSSTLGEYLRVLEDTLPKAFLLENVQGIAYSGKTEAVDLLLSEIEAINHRQGTNYRPYFDTLNAAGYGVPQLRQRFFMIASREGTDYSFPSYTHHPSSEDQESIEGVSTYRTAWDALGDLKTSEDEDLAMRGKWADLLPSIPEGQNYLWHTDRGGGRPLFGWRRRYWSFLLKLAKNLPSWTIQAQPGPAVGPFHWESRLLSQRELCRIQTFPDDVNLVGKRGSVQRQVGNAVPSLLGEVLARSIREQLLDSPITRTLKLLPPDRSPVPAAEITEPVPSKYLFLEERDTSPHPGTGQGPRSQAL